MMCDVFEIQAPRGLAWIDSQNSRANLHNLIRYDNLGPTMCMLFAINKWLFPNFNISVAGIIAHALVILTSSELRPRLMKK